MSSSWSANLLLIRCVCARARVHAHSEAQLEPHAAHLRPGIYACLCRFCCRLAAKLKFVAHHFLLSKYKKDTIICITLHTNVVTELQSENCHLRCPAEHLK